MRAHPYTQTMAGFSNLKVGDRVDVRLTYDDYAALPNDGRTYQLLEGDLFVTPTPKTTHQRVSRNLGHILHAHIKQRHLGAVYYAPVDVILGDNTVVQPDILFVGRQRLNLVSERGIEGGPDVIVEILAPTTRAVDRTTKMHLYTQAGVREYWIVDPEAETLEVFALDAGAYVLTAALRNGETYCSALFKGLEIPLEVVFAADVS